MDEPNPYQSPESTGESTQPPALSLKKRSLLNCSVGGLLMGLGFCGLWLALTTVVDPPMFLSDFVADATKGLVVGTSVGLIVGLMWGLFRVMRAPPPQ